MTITTGVVTIIIILILTIAYKRINLRFKYKELDVKMLGKRDGEEDSPKETKHNNPKGDDIDVS